MQRSKCRTFLQLFFGLKRSYSRDCVVPLPGLDREEQFNFALLKCVFSVFRTPERLASV